MVSTRQHFWILIILLTLLVCPLFLNAQDIISLKPPVVKYLTDVLDPPIIQTNTRPSPQLITIPNKPGGSYVNNFPERRKDTLLPPEIKEANSPKANFTNYNTEDGLAMTSIYCVTEDRNGNLWFGTYGGGVSKYDGKSFTTFSTDQGLVDNLILSITEDRNGNLWFGTDGGGVSKYDGRSFTTFSTDHGLLHNTIGCITEDRNGNLWFGTDGGGVSKYDGKSFTTFSTDHGLEHNLVWSITEDRHGNLWFGTDEGVSKYDGRSFTTLSSDQGLAHNAILSITEDRHGNLWFGTEGGGVSKYDGNSFTTFNTDHGLAENIIHSITEDRNGNFWFGTDGGGISKYDGKSFITFSTDQGLAHNTIYSIIEDRNGNLWFTTDGGGISKYHGKSFTTFSSDQGLAHNLVWSITEDRNGNLWFGTDGGGVSKYDGKSFTTFSTDQGLAHNTIYSINEDRNGNLWFGTDGGGVSRYDGKSFTTFSTDQGLAHNTIFSINEDRNGNLWFGTNGGGVSKYDGKSFTTFNTDQGLADNTINFITEDRHGNLWFGTEGGGVSKYDGKSFTTFSTDQGLAHNRIISISEDMNGNLWFATVGSGVSRYDGKSFITFTTDQGLADGMVYDMKEDNKGVLWLGTNQGYSGLSFKDENEKIISAGVVKVDNQELKQDYVPIWQIYNNSRGYPIKDINAGAMCYTKVGLPYGTQEEKGVLWVGCGDDKVIRFDPREIKRGDVPFGVVLQNIKVNEEIISWYNLLNEATRNRLLVDSNTIAQQEVMSFGKMLSKSARDALRMRFSGLELSGIRKFYPIPENLVVPFKHNHLTIEYNAIITSRNFLVNYQYMLEGQDKTWSPVTKKTDVTYGNLHEGNYIFLLKAQSPDGVWGEPISYSFSVLPPWYRAVWAYFTYVFLVLLVIWGLIQLQTQRIKQKKNELEIKVNKATIEIREKNEILARQKVELFKKNEILGRKNEEKTAMMKEIHHRVKNNLQVVNSLLRLQSLEFEDEHAIAMFKEAQDRVLSMALLHEKMYKSDDLKHIDVQEHISLLAEDLIKSYAVGKIISLDVHIVEVDIGIRTLVPLGLIINEIITNALKYAFIHKNEGEIIVHIKHLENNKSEMIIGDNGVGYNKEKKYSGVGTKLIQIFTKQLNGSLEQLDMPGAVFKLTFEKID